MVEFWAAPGIIAELLVYAGIGGGIYVLARHFNNKRKNSITKKS